MLIGKLLNGKQDIFYTLFRVLVGLMFAQHGLQKIFGMFGGVDGNGGAAPLIGMFGLAGVIELLGGLAIALGLLTRLAALITGAEIFVAYLMVHVSNGLLPIANGGEIALLYFAAYLVIIAYGAGKLSLDMMVLKKEMF